MQVASNRDTCMKCQNLFSRKSKIKYFKMLSAENFTQYAKVSFGKHAYSNILNILQPKKESFQIKKILIFFIFLLKT